MIRQEEAPRFLVTTSWDDGHPLDDKLGGLLEKYGIAGTFYIPNKNLEGRDVLDTSSLRRLAATFEIGGHGSDHRVMTEMSGVEIKNNIRNNKQYLEQATGKAISGFCYIQGRHNYIVRNAVKAVGYKYARTVRNFDSELAQAPYEMSTTLQFYPHGRISYTSNFVRAPFTLKRTRLFGAALASGNLVNRISRVFEMCQRSGNYFHLWGHSWEIEQNDLWGQLELVFSKLSRTPQIEFATNYEVCARFGLFANRP